MGLVAPGGFPFRRPSRGVSSSSLLLSTMAPPFSSFFFLFMNPSCTNYFRQSDVLSHHVELDSAFPPPADAVDVVLYAAAAAASPDFQTSGRSCDTLVPLRPSLHFSSLLF